MKPREIIYALGLRPPPVMHAHCVRRAQLADDGPVEYAHWHYHRDGECAVRGEEVADLRRFLRKGDFAIDIGAHIGDTALPIALACGAEGLVLALEPNPHVFDVLCTTSRLNRSKTNIVPLPYAATETAGRFVFRYSDPSYANGGRFAGLSVWRHFHSFPLTVEGRTLASILALHAERLPRLRYIKIDIEGDELRLLRSIEPLLVAHRPYVKTEIHRHACERDRRDIFRLLGRAGYTLRHVESHTLFGDELTEQDVLRWPHFDVFAVPA